MWVKKMMNVFGEHIVSFVCVGAKLQHAMHAS